MSQVQIKEIINSFCKIIVSFNFSSLSPEDLRLAKFNKPNVVIMTFIKNYFELKFNLSKTQKELKMWTFLNELLKYFSVDKEINVQFAINSQTVRRIKMNMIKLGYNNNDFNCLPEAFNDDHCSSQEVLLACAWIISTQDLITLFLSSMSYLFEEEYFKDMSKIENSLTETKKETDYLKLEHKKINDSNIELNYLKRLEHNFKSKLNSLHSCLREKSKLTNEVI